MNLSKKVKFKQQLFSNSFFSVRPTESDRVAVAQLFRYGAYGVFPADVWRVIMSEATYMRYLLKKLDRSIAL